MRSIEIPLIHFQNFNQPSTPEMFCFQAKRDIAVFIDHTFARNLGPHAACRKSCFHSCGLSATFLDTNETLVSSEKAIRLFRLNTSR